VGISTQDQFSWKSKSILGKNLVTDPAGDIKEIFNLLSGDEFPDSFVVQSMLF
jgi:hypothetical protein